MKNFLIFFLISASFYFGCKQNGSKGMSNEEKKNDTTHFFQVAEFIEAQIAEVNKTPYFIYKIYIIDGKKDSTPINTALFNQISAQFLKPDINDKALKKYYIESIFHDQTTKSFTISYTTRDKQLEIQNLDVLLQEDGQTVKRIFIRKFFNYPESTALEQLSWKPGESFQVNRLVQKRDNKENTYETKVVWNEKD